MRFGHNRWRVGAVALAVVASVFAGIAVSAESGGRATANAIGASFPSGQRAVVSSASEGPPAASASEAGIVDAAGQAGGVAVRSETRGQGAQAVAEASASANDIALANGRVRVASIRVTVRSEAGPDGTTAGVVENMVSGVVVDGVPVVPVAGNEIDVPGAGTLIFFERVSGDAGSVRANALRFDVTASVAGAPEGTSIVVGHVEVSAAAGDATAPDAPPAPTGQGSALPPADPPATVSASGPSTARPRAIRRAAPVPPTQERTGSGPLTPAGPEGRARVVVPRALPDIIATPQLTPLPSPLTLPRLEANPVAFAPTNDGYVFPVFGHVGFTDDYGAPRAVTGWHKGNDIFGERGLPVLAVADGVLSQVGVNRIGGNRLWLKDTRGNTYYYAHMAAYAPGIESGVRVSAGQVIGFVGNTGQAITTPPHLHFEVHPGGGDNVNPYPYLMAWSRSGDLPLAYQAATLGPGSAPAVGALLVASRQAVDDPLASGDGLATVAP
ncbi:MAG: M23 family metallopeptidase [Actinobacteria bacterium]|nr:M23 family metallopeptidase [Actinomycetota bacterium]